MKTLIFNRLLLLFFVFFAFNLAAQNVQSFENKYFQQSVEYKIDATLDTTQHTLSGTVSFKYYNASPDALSFLYVHLWANAFGTRNSAFARQTTRQGNTKFYFADEDDLGKYQNLNWQLSEKKQPLEVKTDKKNPDIIKILLPKPLATGESVTIETPFFLKIPKDFSRLGRKEQKDGSTAYYITQWFPKPAVYDKTGWHPMPYLDLGEFYSDFGNYDVTLTLPANMVVAATGTVDERSEYNFLRAKAQNPLTKHHLAGTQKTLHFKANSVVDFAWFAAPNFEVAHDSVTLSNGKTVETWGFYPPQEAKYWTKSAKFVKRAVEFYSDNVGVYPFPQASAVCGGTFGGGMEYPMVTLINASGSEKSLDIVIAHEVGHNWFQGILATNERDQPWMDEGMNTFYERRYEAQFYPPKNTEKRLKTLDQGETLQDFASSEAHDVCSAMNSDSMGSMINYFLFAYDRPARMLKKLEQMMGVQKFDQAMQAYYKWWQFKHPTPQDFEQNFQNEIGYSNRPFFDDLFYKNDNFVVVDSATERLDQRFRLKFFNPNTIANNRTLYVAPILGGNAQDGFMLGLGLMNHVINQPRLRMELAPMFGFKSKDLVGVANLDFSTKATKIGQITSGIGWKRFNVSQIISTNEALGYQRWSPYVRYEFPKRAMSSWSKSVQIRALLVQEDTVGLSSASVLTVAKQHSWIPELSFLATRTHGLGNSFFKIALEQQKYKDYFGGDNQYLRLALTGVQSVAYRSKRFVEARVFVGTFLKNTGAERGNFFGDNSRGSFSVFQNGAADYRYDQLFFSRGGVSGGGSQQIAETGEGGVRLPMNPQFQYGLSNDFVATFNLTADLPMTNLLKAYYDVGYFRDTRPVGEDKANWLVQTLGLTLDLKVARVNFPIWSSPDRLTNLLAERGGYGKRITFSIDLNRYNILRNPKVINELF